MDRVSKLEITPFSNYIVFITLYALYKLTALNIFAYNNYKTNLYLNFLIFITLKNTLIKQKLNSNYNNKCYKETII